MTISEDKKKETQLSIAPTLPVEVEVESSNSDTPAQSSSTSFIENPIKDRTKQIMDHLKKSGHDFKHFSTASKERNSKIREHIQKSLS